MVNKKRLLELLGDKYYTNEWGILVRTDNSCLWTNDDLEEINSIHQLWGRCNDCLDIEIYDEICSKVDDSIFEVNIEKVEENLAKIGLPYRGADEKGNVQIFRKTYIRKHDLKHVEKMEYIPVFNGKYSDGMKLYNQVLRASKNWGKETKEDGK